MSEQKVQIIGIDAATQETDIGLARATAIESTGAWSAEVCEVVRGSKTESVVSRLREWLSNSERTLIAIDAPLGWPHEFREQLNSHEAGDSLSAIPNTEDMTEICDAFFFRHTDRWVKEEVLEDGNRPMSVCADRIARASYSILLRLRQLNDYDFPLIEGREELEEGPGVIEIYPKATLTVMNESTNQDLLEPSYKSNEEQRRKIIAAIAEQELQFDIAGVADRIKKNDDELDAVISALGGLDFLRGDVWMPGEIYERKADELNLPDDETRWRKSVRREGWIWCRKPV